MGSSLYKAGLFLRRRRLVKVALLGIEMIQSYTRCAAMAVSRSLSRFKLTPKYHMLMHVVYQLSQDKDANREPVNPLAFSCQMPEDFINRVATLARSVSPRFCAGENLGALQGCTHEGVGVKKSAKAATFRMLG